MYRKNEATFAYIRLTEIWAETVFLECSKGASRLLKNNKSAYGR